MPAATYEPLATTTLGSATSTVSFTSISGSYTDLVLVFAYKANSSNNPTLKLTFNDSSTSYSGTQLTGLGSSGGNDTTPSSTRNTSAAFISIARAAGTPLTSGNVGVTLIHIMNYANTSVYKTVLARAGAADGGLEADVGLWQNTSAITKVEITTSTSNDFAIGSQATLYGIKAE